MSQQFACAIDRARQRVHRLHPPVLVQVHPGDVVLDGEARAVAVGHGGRFERKKSLAGARLFHAAVEHQ
ncbi:hypothetical protein ACFPOA_02400 [Lysobacter niabensis]|uniref:hypothetical protein n=1 Tax=Agrilutibacter niabensis TaxID=380628 RepID=UPI003612D2D7